MAGAAALVIESAPVVPDRLTVVNAELAIEEVVFPKFAKVTVVNVFDSVAEAPFKSEIIAAPSATPSAAVTAGVDTAVVICPAFGVVLVAAVVVPTTCVPLAVTACTAFTDAA